MTRPDPYWADRFWSYVAIGPECWVWIGPIRKDGYGTMRVHSRHKLAHRLSYEYIIGPIPDELQIDHLCRNRWCVNPAHLEPVTQKVNLLRGDGHMAKLARQTHCKRGHPFDEENTYVYPNGRRKCRACQRGDYNY